ncbi:MAG: hypothetical protein ACI9LN_004314 [Saprospiraceae bacterium]|jgi:hypothetical protein
MDSIKLFKNKRAEITIPKERGILIICMIIASIFWFVVKMSKVYITDRVVQIDYTLPEGKAFAELPPEEFEAQVEGTGWNLMYDFFISAQPKVTFDLNTFLTSTIERDQMVKRINEQLFKLLEVKDVSSLSQRSFGKDYIILDYETRFEKKLPVLFDGLPSFQQGYDYLDLVVITPDSVLVSGPFSLVESLTHWKTDLVEATDLKENFTQEVQLKVPEIGQVFLKPEKVRVDITVEEFTENSLFIPVTLKNQPDSIRIFPAKVQIQFVVGLTMFNQITADSFLLEADFQGIARNAANNTVPLSLIKQPKEISGVNLKTKSVEFFILEQEEVAQ